MIERIKRNSTRDIEREIEIEMGKNEQLPRYTHFTLW